ncbi:MAG: GIY-YIG nuclease family protein [Gemmatimonadaceae bacterium]|nr:GIY-YIG nuclease family protein [Gemmatimonadaceae bacterium]
MREAHGQAVEGAWRIRTAGSIRQDNDKTPANTTIGLLYAIQSTHGGPIKIGWTSSSGGLSGRLTSLQIGNPYPLRVIWTKPGSRLDEQILHRKYRKLRLSGEWFAADGEITDFFGAIREHYPLETLYERAYEAGWERGFDDAGATDKENADPRRAEAIEEHSEAERIYTLTGNRRPLQALHKALAAHWDDPSRRLPGEWPNGSHSGDAS